MFEVPYQAIGISSSAGSSHGIDWLHSSSSPSFGVGEAVDRVELRQAGRDVVLGRGDELEQRLGVVGRDQRVGQRRAERRGCGVSASRPSGVTRSVSRSMPRRPWREQGAVGVLREQRQTAVQQVGQAESLFLVVPAGGRAIAAGVAGRWRRGVHPAGARRSR